jgi:RNA polymerase sigma factor (TIGR02999 family)
MNAVMSPPPDLSRLLDDYRAGRPQALEALVPLVYDDLRRIARRSLRQFGELTLNTTGLVHETYLKLCSQQVLRATDRAHFLAICARAMRQFVLNHVRDRSAIKRGSGLQLLNLEDVEVTHEPDADQLIFIDEALRQLAQLDEDLVRVFECRFFAGMTDEETAVATARPLRSVQRDWMRARAWIRELIEARP